MCNCLLPMTTSPVFLYLTERTGLALGSVLGLRPALGASCQSLRLQQAGTVTHCVSSEDPESLPAIEAGSLPSPCKEGGWVGGAAAVSAKLWGASPCCHGPREGTWPWPLTDKAAPCLLGAENRKSASPSPQSSAGREAVRVPGNLGSVSHKTWVSSRRTSLTTRSMLIIGLKYRAQ